MHWIKKVEMVDSVDDLKSPSSVRGIRTPDFEALDASLNRIIRNVHFKRRIRQRAYLIYEHFRVTGANDSVENYADLFTMVFRNDDVQEFDSKWDEILLSVTEIPPDDILEGLYKLRTLRNSRPHWNCTISRFIRKKLDLMITE